MPIGGRLVAAEPVCKKAKVEFLSSRHLPKPFGEMTRDIVLKSRQYFGSPRQFWVETRRNAAVIVRSPPIFAKDTNESRTRT